jgi:hypothetical protein
MKCHQSIQDESDVSTERLSIEFGLSKKPTHGIKQVAVQPVCNAKREKDAIEATSITAHVFV